MVQVPSPQPKRKTHPCGAFFFLLAWRDLRRAPSGYTDERARWGSAVVRCRWQMKHNRTSVQLALGYAERVKFAFGKHCGSQRSSERRRGQTDAGTATGICSHTLSVSLPQPCYASNLDANPKNPRCHEASGFFCTHFSQCDFNRCQTPKTPVDGI